MSSLGEFGRAMEALPTDDTDSWADKLLSLLDVPVNVRTLAVAQHVVLVMKILMTEASLLDLQEMMRRMDPPDIESLIDTVSGRIGPVMLDEYKRKADESWVEIGEKWEGWK